MFCVDDNVARGPLFSMKRCALPRHTLHRTRTRNDKDVYIPRFLHPFLLSLTSRHVVCRGFDPVVPLRATLGWQTTFPIESRIRAQTTLPTGLDAIMGRR